MLVLEVEGDKAKTNCLPEDVHGHTCVAEGNGTRVCVCVCIHNQQ